VRRIAAIRDDKRGIASSRSAAVSDSALRFVMLADDAAAWVRQARTDRRITTMSIIGHIEGSLLGMLATQRAPVDAFVSIAGPARCADLVLHDQLASALPTALLAQSDSALARLAAGDTVTQTPPGLDALFRPSVQPYLISWFRYTPSAVLAKLRVPVLIARGTYDFQVMPTEAALLAAAEPRATTLTVAGMNDVLKLTPADRSQQIAGTYVDPAIPLAAPLFDSLVAFVGRAARSAGDGIGPPATRAPACPWHTTFREPPSRSDRMALPDPLISASPERLGGTPVFAGTRVPVQSLIECLEAGDSLDVFLDAFPSVTRPHAIAVLELAKRALVAHAPAA